MTENVDKEEEGVESRLSVGAEQVLMYAESYAENSSDETVRLVHLLKGICSLKESYAVYYMQKQGVDETDLTRALMAIDLIDEAGAYRKLHPTRFKIQKVGKDVIDTVLTNICRVPVETSGMRKEED